MAELCIHADLAALADPAYRAFQSRLLPTVDPSRILGVRMPDLRRYAKTIAGTDAAEAFLRELPHPTYDADNLHAALLCRIRDRAELIAAIDAFLPYIDNWATCDSLRPSLLARDIPALRCDIARWMAAEGVYPCRFGIEMLMLHCLDDAFAAADLAAVGEIARTRGGEYYLAMMCAWYYATALSVQPEATLHDLRQADLPRDVLVKTVRKACESRRIGAALRDAVRELL